MLVKISPVLAIFSSVLAKISSVLVIFSSVLAKILSVMEIFLSTSIGKNIICIGVIFICGGENIFRVDGKLCILFLSLLAKISSALAIFSSALAKIWCALVKIWSVLAVFSSVLVENYVYYYPPRDVFALNTGKYRPGCIFFVYTGARVLWILSVINFRFFNNISRKVCNLKICIIYH